jgi:hypothetical protein
MEIGKLVIGNNLPELRAIIIESFCTIKEKLELSNLPKLAMVQYDEYTLNGCSFTNLPNLVICQGEELTELEITHCPNLVTRENFMQLRKCCKINDKEYETWEKIEYTRTKAEKCKHIDDFWVCLRLLAIYNLKARSEAKAERIFYEYAAIFYVRATGKQLPCYWGFEKMVHTNTYDFDVYLIYEEGRSLNTETRRKLQGCPKPSLPRGSGEFVYPAFFVLESGIPNSYFHVQEEGVKRMKVGEEKGVNVLTDAWVSPNARGMKLSDRVMKNPTIKAHIVNAFLDDDALDFWKHHNVPSGDMWKALGRPSLPLDFTIAYHVWIDQMHDDDY